MPRPPRLVVASYNVHGGVDGWGRPYDVVAECERLDPDVLVLQESWHPDGRPSLAQRVADRLGCSVTEFTSGRGRITVPDVDP
jgi:endonuclease/exonuclease/phosphatase family metal-dependent hydrolase